MLANVVATQLICPESLVKVLPSRIFFAVAFGFFPMLSRGLGLSEHSVSPSGQFFIYGADTATRGAVSELAEQVKSNFLSVLKRRDRWKIPVVVNLQLRAVNLPEIPFTDLRFSRTESGLKLQLDVALAAKTDMGTIERALARVIVLEMIYRHQSAIAPGDVYVDPPAWLLDGLLAAAPNKDRAELFAALSTPLRDIKLAEFLIQRPEMLDLSARQLYRAYSFALVQMLIDSPDGRSRLGRYIDKLAFATNDPLADLRAAFPKLTDFGNAWKMEIAALKAGADKELLSFSTSDEKLNVLLKEFVPLEGFSRAKPESIHRRALQELSQKLLLLATRANPVLRPVIQDYQRIADQLVLGRNRGIAKRLADLKSLHATLSARMSDVADYLNWFEAAKLETPSGLFGPDLKAKTATDTRKLRRKDALSVYLDAMEMEF